jgi:hypothetical protein
MIGVTLPLFSTASKDIPDAQRREEFDGRLERGEHEEPAANK